jgi:hypothetical protein
MAYRQHHNVSGYRTLSGAYASDFATCQIDIRHHHTMANFTAKFLNASAKRLHHGWKAVTAQMGTLFV